MAKDLERPICHDRPMRPIVYGMPGGDLMELSERGEIELGGCCIPDDMPRFSCAVCGRTEGRIDDIDEHMTDDEW
jgi:hypothetical protein